MCITRSESVCDKDSIKSDYLLYVLHFP